MTDALLGDTGLQLGEAASRLVSNMPEGQKFFQYTFGAM